MQSVSCETKPCFIVGANAQITSLAKPGVRVKVDLSVSNSWKGLGHIHRSSGEGMEPTYTDTKGWVHINLNICIYRIMF